MKADNDDKRLEELIRVAIGRGRLSFDFPQWKRRHRDRVEEFRSQAQLPACKLPRSFSRHMTFHRGPAAGLVAAAAVCMVVLLFLAGEGQPTLRAQALKAIQQARTLHVTTREYHNGQHIEDHEVWYDRQAGIMEQERYESRTDVRIDNGTYEWRYVQGRDCVGRQRSYRDNDELMMELCAAWQNLHPRRVPSGDTQVVGFPCRMYVISDSDGSCSLWADEESRVRRVEQTRQGQAREGQTRLFMEIEYDVAIDPQRFGPSFPPNVKTFDPRQRIEQQYPLDTALFTRKTLGFIFAVHRLELCREGLKYLVCSNRLTDQTRQKIDATHPWTFYGSADLREVASSWSCDRVELLARMSHDGICVDWYLLLPGDAQGADTSACDVDVDISTANQLAESLKADGSPTHEQFRLVIPREKLRPTPASLADLLGDLYALGEQLDPLVHSFLLIEVLGNPGARVWRRPGLQLSKEQYVANVEQRAKNGSQRY